MFGDFLSALSGDWGPANIISPQPMRQGVGQGFSALGTALHNALTGQPIGYPSPAAQEMARAFSGASTLDQIRQGAATMGNAQNPLETVGGAKDIVTAPVNQYFKAVNEIPIGGIAGGLERLQGNSDPNLTATKAFEHMPWYLQMGSYVANPLASLGSITKVPAVVGQTAEGAPILGRVEQGALSANMGLDVAHPFSQIETAAAQLNPIYQASRAFGKLMGTLIQLTPGAKGLQAADAQNKVVQTFGQLLSNAGVDMTPDQWFSQIKVLKGITNKNIESDEAKAASLRLMDAEDKISEYLQGRPVGSAVAMPEQAASSITTQAPNPVNPALPSGVPPVPYTSNKDWMVQVKSALKDSGEQKVYITDSDGQRYAVAAISPGSDLRQRVFSGTSVRTLSGDQVDIGSVVKVENPQGEVLAYRTPATEQPIGFPNNPPAPIPWQPPVMPSARDQKIVDQAHQSDVIQNLVKDYQAMPALSQNLIQRLDSLGVDHNQLMNALSVRAGVRDAVAKIANNQVDALDNIAQRNPTLQVRGPDDVLKAKFQAASQGALPFLNNLRSAVKAGQSYVPGGDLSTVADNPDLLKQAVDKGFNDSYVQAMESLAKLQPQSGLSKMGSTLRPFGAPIVNAGLALQATGDPILSLILGAGSAALNETGPGRAVGMAMKQTRRILPYWISLMQSDEGFRSLLNGTIPFLSPKTILSKATQIGAAGPDAENVLANAGDVAQWNPWGKTLEDVLNQARLGPAAGQGQIEGQNMQGIGKLGQYISNLFGGNLGTDALAGYMGKAETFANRIRDTQDAIMRSSAAIQGTEQALNAVAPHYANLLDNTAPAAAQELRSQGGMVSQKRLADLLDQDGLQGDQREGILGGWQKALDAAQQQGTELADKIHYNYRYGTSVDQAASNFFLNHAWATRNLQYYPQMLAEHPWTLPMIGEFLDTLDKKREEGQGTLRLLGMQPFHNPLSQLLGTLFGQNGEAFTDQLYGQSLESQLFPIYKGLRPYAEMLSGQTPQGKPENLSNILLDSLGGMSMGMQPISQMGLQAAGATGDRSYNPFFALASSLLNAGAARGKLPLPTDLAGNPAPYNVDPFSYGANLLKSVHTGWKPGSVDYRVQNEATHLAMEQGLNPDDTNVMLAVNDPRSPLYQQAARRVAGQEALSGLNRSIGGPEVQFESKGEQAIQRLAGDPLFTPNLKDPIEAMMVSRLYGIPINDQNAKMLEQYYARQQKMYELAKVQGNVNSDAVLELLARMGSGSGPLSETLKAHGLSVKGGDTPTVVDSSGKPIDPNVARSIILQSSPEPTNFAQAYQAARQAGNVPPFFRHQYETPSESNTQMLSQWTHGSYAQRTQMLQDPNIVALLQRNGVPLIP